MFSLVYLVIVLRLYLAFGDSHDTDTTLFPLHRFSIEYFAPYERYIILLHLCFVHSHSAIIPRFFLEFLAIVFADMLLCSYTLVIKL